MDTRERHLESRHIAGPRDSFHARGRREGRAISALGPLEHHGGRRRGHTAGGCGEAPVGGQVQAHVLEGTSRRVRVRRQGGQAVGGHRIQRVPEDFR